jgi:hypothetical protein
LLVGRKEDQKGQRNIGNYYRHLFQILHSFRTYKSHLETQLMFHCTDKQINQILEGVKYTIFMLLRTQLFLDHEH